MVQGFDNIPSGVLKTPERFTLRVPDQDLDEFKQLLQLSKIGPETWYNKQADGRFGVTREWLINAKDAWLKFDWRKQEDRINSFPNFKSNVEHPELGTVGIHFTALFSNREDAVPIIFMHGWPGSFQEFLPMLDLLVEKYTPDTLPYHIIVASLPGYGLSADSIPLETETRMASAADCLHQLMLDLGFGGGYVAQGGDVGSLLAKLMSMKEGCKAYHLNMLFPGKGDNVGSPEALSQQDQERLRRRAHWQATGISYALEHGFRPSTIGLVLSSNPLALLAWIGEKFLEWVDTRYPLPLEAILESVSLYWFTSTFPRSLYPYRSVVESMTSGTSAGMDMSKETPLGYSVFPHELSFMPKPWAEEIYPNLKLYRTHDKGGHFAALEQPEIFLQDIEDFLQLVKTPPQE